MRLSYKSRALAGAALGLALVGTAGAAAAQNAPIQVTAADAAAHEFNVPSQPLAQAAIRFTEQAGVQLVFDASTGRGVTSNAVVGRFTVGQALDQLLGGTGLVWRLLGNGTVTIERPLAGARTLGAVQVEGVQTDAFASLNGFGAGAGGNGSSDPTATEGTGSLTTNGATVASKTPQSLKDTPQSVTVMTTERIQQQNLTDMTSALAYMPGVTLASSINGGTLESTFYSRGFTISTFQIDGGGPLSLNTNSYYESTPNLAEFDNIQVLRGSDAMFGGMGQPGGVVSLERKRPLDHDQFLGDVNIGSWNNYQVQADVTGPIAFDGHVRARLVATDQDRGFFYESAHENKAFVYGVLEADLGPKTVVRAGASFERKDDTGYNVNGVPRYADGSDLNLPRSTNFAAPWSYWNFSTPEYFASLEHRFNADWGLKINVTRVEQDSDNKYTADTNPVIPGHSNLNYQVQQIDQTSDHEIEYTADGTVNGSLDVFGLTQSLIAGADYSLSNGRSTVYTLYNVIPINPFTFSPNNLNPEPARPPLQDIVPIERQEQWGGYVTVNLQPIRALHLIAGVRDSSYSSELAEVGYYGSPRPLFSSKSSTKASGVLTPYGSATYGVTHDIMLYASYADIFQVQSGGIVFDPNGKVIPPETGATYEAGVKGAFKGGKLNAALSFFYTNESNIAVPYSGGPCHGGNGYSCDQNTGGEISQGLDLEISGEILPGWQVQAGYTFDRSYYNQVSESKGHSSPLGSSFQTQQPEHQIKLWTSYTPTGQFNRWTLGSGFRLESARFTKGTVCNEAVSPTTGFCPDFKYLPFAITQSLYTVTDLRVAYRINAHWQAALDLTNIADTRYYTTAGYPYGGNFYGEPRAFMFSIRAKY